MFFIVNKMINVKATKCVLKKPKAIPSSIKAIKKYKLVKRCTFLTTRQTKAFNEKKILNLC